MLLAKLHYQCLHAGAPLHSDDLCEKVCTSRYSAPTFSNLMCSNLSTRLHSLGTRASLAQPAPRNQCPAQVMTQSPRDLSFCSRKHTRDGAFTEKSCLQVLCKCSASEMQPQTGKNPGTDRKTAKNRPSLTLSAAVVKEDLEQCASRANSRTLSLQENDEEGYG
jgi:hypothetical protein